MPLQEKGGLKMDDKNSYLFNIARTVAGQLKIPQPEKGEMRLGVHVVSLASSQLGPLMYTFFGPQLEDAIRKRWSPEARGKVAALGLGKTSGGRMTLTRVHLADRWLDGDISGDDLLIRIATTTIIAAIIDNLRSDDRKNPVRNGYAEREHGTGGHRPATPAATPAMSLGLDYYDNRRERGTNGSLVPYAGQFGVYRE